MEAHLGVTRGDEQDLKTVSPAAATLNSILTSSGPRTRLLLNMSLACKEMTVTSLN